MIGAEFKQRQHLAQALKQVLLSLDVQSTMHLPQLPSNLDSTPADAAHLLWTLSGSAIWRSPLSSLNRPYQVVQGPIEDALKQCVYALLPPAQAQGWARQPAPVRWSGVCEACGDADCEQRLFSRLLQR